MTLTQEMKPSELTQGRPHEPHRHFIANRVEEKRETTDQSSGLSVLLSGRAQVQIELLATTGSESRGKCPEQQMGLC